MGRLNITKAFFNWIIKITSTKIIVGVFFLGGEILNEISIKEILRSKEEKRILTGKISGIEDEYYKIKNEYISCAVVWYQDIKVLIPSTHLGIEKINKSMIRGMLGAEIDFIVIEYDSTSNIAIASRKDAMELRATLEIPKLKVNDVVKVRILVRIPAKFNNYPHYLDNMLIRITEIREDKKLIYGYLIFKRRDSSLSWWVNSRKGKKLYATTKSTTTSARWKTNKD